MFTVFISHNTKDTLMTWLFGYLLKNKGFNVYVSEQNPEPGKPLAEKIQRQINTSDCVLVLLTREGARSASVNQEIGYAKSRKLIVPVVEKGVDVGVLLYGLEYITFDSTNPADAIEKAGKYIEKLRLQKKQREAMFGIVGSFIFDRILR